MKSVQCPSKTQDPNFKNVFDFKNFKCFSQENKM